MVDQVRRLLLLFLFLSGVAQAQPVVGPCMQNGPCSLSSLTLQSLNNTPIGNTTPSTGAFTTLGASGTAQFGTGSANFATISGISGGAVIATAGSGTNASLALRSLGSGASGAVNIGPSVGGNVLSLIGASSAGSGTITLTQPASSILPFSFGLTTNTAGIQWTNLPQRIQNTWAWSGLGSAVGNRSFQVANTISGTVQDPNAGVATAIPFNVVSTLNGFNASGQGFRGAWFQTITGANTFGPTITGLAGTVVQTGAPGTPVAWTANTSYPTVGALAVSPTNAQIYRVETAGTSSTVAPTGSTFTDGTVVWSNQGPASSWVQAISLLGQGQSNFNAGGTVTTAAVTFTNGSANIGWANTLVAGSQVYFTVTGGTLPTNFSPIKTYYVIATGLSSSNIQVAATPGGAAIVAGSAGSGSPVGNDPQGPGAARVGVQWGGLISSGSTANATNYSESNGLEVDDNFQGVGIGKTTGIQIVKAGQSGIFTDVGLSISCSGGAAICYRNTIRLATSTSPIGYAFGSYDPSNSHAQQHLAGWLDGRLVVPDGAGQFGGGFFLRWGNGSINQDGGIRARYGSIQPTSSGLTIDAPLVELTTLNVTNGGANWSVGQQWQGDDGSSGVVASVTGGPPGSISTGTSSLTVVIPSQHLTPPGSVTITATTVSLGVIGTTGNPLWPTPAVATPTYAAPATPTVNIGTGSATAINIGWASSTTTLAGTIKAGASTGVSCPSGVTAGTVVVVNGIVTHC